MTASARRESGGSTEGKPSVTSRNSESASQGYRSSRTLSFSLLVFFLFLFCMIIFFLSNVRFLACARVCPSPESRKQDIRKWCSEDPLPCVERSSYTYTCVFSSSAACCREWIGLAFVGSAASVRGCTQVARVISATGKRIGCANKGSVSRAGLVVGHR